jgi:hypothetical protein
VRGRTGRAALGKPPAEIIRQLWQRWLTHAVIEEFSRIEEIKGFRFPPTRRAGPNGRPRR